MQDFLNGPIVSTDPESGIVTKEFTPCCDACLDTHKMVSEIHSLIKALMDSPMAAMLPGMGGPAMPVPLQFKG